MAKAVARAPLAAGGVLAGVQSMPNYLPKAELEEMCSPTDGRSAVPPTQALMTVGLRLDLKSELVCWNDPPRS